MHLFFEVLQALLVRKRLPAEAWVQRRHGDMTAAALNLVQQDNPARPHPLRGLKLQSRASTSARFLSVFGGLLLKKPGGAPLGAANCSRFFQVKLAQILQHRMRVSRVRPLFRIERQLTSDTFAASTFNPFAKDAGSFLNFAAFRRSGSRGNRTSETDHLSWSPAHTFQPTDTQHVLSF